MQRRKTHAAKLLEALSDGRSWSTHELVEYGCGYAVHSRVSDLRHLGYAIPKPDRRRTTPGEADVYFYELVGVPPVAHPMEELVDEPAAARIGAMRAAGGTTSASKVSLGSAPPPPEPEQARDAETEAPRSLSPQPAAAAPAVAAGPPTPAVATPSVAAGVAPDDDEQLALDVGVPASSSRVEASLLREQLGRRAA